MTSFGNKGHARAVCLGACQRDTGKDDEDSLPGWPGCTIAAPEVQLRVVVAGITEIACAFTYSHCPLVQSLCVYIAGVRREVALYFVCASCD